MSVVFQVVAAATSVLLVVLVLAHRGSGGGLSDLLGGGGSQGTSAKAPRNLTRLTLAVAGLWLAAVVTLGLLAR